MVLDDAAMGCAVLHAVELGRAVCRLLVIVQIPHRHLLGRRSRRRKALLVFAQLVAAQGIDVEVKVHWTCQASDLVGARFAGQPQAVVAQG